MENRQALKYLTKIGITKEFLNSLGIKTIIVNNTPKAITLYIHYLKDVKIDIISISEIENYLSDLKSKIRKEKILKLLSSN